MAYEQPGFSFTLPAAADLSGSQFCMVDVDTNGNAALPSAAGRAVGCLQNKPTLGVAATIVQSGIVMAKAGGTVTLGHDVQVDSSGRVVDQTSTGKKVGVALEGTTTANDIVTVLLDRGETV